MVLHTARAESRVKCCSLPPSLALLCFAQPAGRRANWFGVGLVGHSGYMETNPATFFLLDNLTSFSDFV